jgi:hypothetical protein
LYDSRINTIFLWSGHLFPSITEMPEYPDASDLNPEQLKQNQEQFRWFTDECAKRNINVLLHFYNIHITKSLAESREIAQHYAQPDSFVAEYYKYALGRFFDEFQAIGLYVCPGEALRAEYQPEWIRDVIFAAAKESGKNPLIVIRDWGMDKEKFLSVCADEYDNFYTELKHNIEMVVSPVPDERHKEWLKDSKTHIVNLHEAADIKPYRWGSPLFIREMVENWQAIGLDGAEVYGLISWRWPNTLDRLDSSQTDYWPEGPRLLTFERDPVWLQAIGRYMWETEREPAQEKKYWTAQFAEKFGNQESGKLLYDWYTTTGPIMPGLQNNSSIINMNWFPTAIGRDQLLDLHIYFNQEDIGEYARYKGIYNTRPFDEVVMDRYKAKYGTKPENPLRLSVLETVEAELAGGVPENRIAIDKMAELLVEMAEDGLYIAKEMADKADKNQEEVKRFVNDSRLIRLTAKFYREKTLGALDKARWIMTDEIAYLDSAIAHLERAVDIYAELCQLGEASYIYPSDMKNTLTWEWGEKHQREELAYHRSLRKHPEDFPRDKWENMSEQDMVQFIWTYQLFEEQKGYFPVR